MRLGMTAAVTVDVDDKPSELVIPLSALSEIDGNPVVFVVDRASNIVRRRPVSVDGVAGDGARIADGLRAGDMVVTAGAQFLHEGMPVRVPAEL